MREYDAVLGEFEGILQTDSGGVLSKGGKLGPVIDAILE